jgi:hypothetical protein
MVTQAMDTQTFLQFQEKIGEGAEEMATNGLASTECCHIFSRSINDGYDSRAPNEAKVICFEPILSVFFCIDV